MTTYKQKYHLKKTQPINNKQRITNNNYNRQTPKSQKATTLKSIPNQRRNLKDKYSNRLSDFLIKQQKTPKNIKQNNKNQFQEHKEKINLNQISTTSINQQRAHSISIVQKFSPPKNYQPLQYPKRNTIQSLQKINIFHSVQNFFTRMIKPDNGCICQEPCQWASKLFKWVDIPEHLVIQHYNNLRQKAHQKIVNRNNGIFQTFQKDQQKLKNIEKQKSFKQIKKDVERTHSDSQTFRNPIYRRRLQNILKCYVIQDIKMGYVQGMNMILAGILYHVKQQAKSYSVFRKLLYSIRSIYLQNFNECYTHINRIQHLLKNHLFDIWIHFGKLDIQLHMICLPWVLSLLTSIVPLQSIHLIYNGFIKERWNFIYKICLSIFAYFKQQIKQAPQSSEVLMMFAASQDIYSEIDWDDIVKYGETIEVSFSN